MTITQKTSIKNGQSYLEKNPTWHAEDSPWKASQVIQMIQQHNLNPSRIIEVGCGAGEILNQLYQRLPNHIHFLGYEISEDAIALCQLREKDRLTFILRDFLRTDEYADLVLLLDVIEHVEDCFGFLRACGQRGHYKIYHFPLELTVSNLLRNNLITARIKVEHLHFYCKDTVLSLLKDTGHEVIDWFYTPSNEMAKHWRTKLMNVPRKLLFDLNKDFAVRLLGGYSMLVLAK